MPKQKKMWDNILTVIMSVLCLLWIYPIVLILLNSLKKEGTFTTSTVFQLPTSETFAGLSNYVYGVIKMGFLSSLGYSLVITVSSVALILLCCSMTGWYLTRVNNKLSKFMNLLIVFSMVVPFQMVMFTLSKTADQLKLNTPWSIPVVYLGFGAGLLSRRKWSVYYGTLIGGVLRFLVHYLIGVFVWGVYMPDEFFGMTMTSPWFYSLLYNLAYMLPNIAITLLVFAVAYKPLKKYFTASDLLPSPAAAQPVKDPTSPKWDPER